MLTAGSILLLAVHFIAVDVAMAAPLACIWLARRSSRHGDQLAGRLDAEMARVHRSWRWRSASPVGMPGTGDPLAGRRPRFLRRAAAVAPGRLWFSLAELIFFALCMAAYLWLAGRPIRRPWLAAILALLASLDLMAHFPPLFTMLNLLADRPSLFGQRIGQPTLSLAALRRGSPEHDGPCLSGLRSPSRRCMVMRAGRMATGRCRWRRGRAGGCRRPAVLLGSARSALLATALQMPVGI